MSDYNRALTPINGLNPDQGWPTGGNSGTMMAQTPEQPRSGDLNSPYHLPRMSQLPMNLVRDTPGDGRTIDGSSNTGSTADSVRSFESMRDIHEFIREFNGRTYNAQNPIYFLPAGQSESESLILQCYFPSPSAFPRRIYHSRPLPLVQIKPSTAGCTYPIPLASLYSVHDTCSVTSNIFAIAFVLVTCTHILTWSTSSYDLNLVLRRKLSISVGPLVCYPS